MDDAVDLRRVALAATLAAVGAALVDQHVEPLADLRLLLGEGDRLRFSMKRRQRLSLTSSGTQIEPEIVGARAAHRLVFEGADAVELGFVEPVEQQPEILLRLAGKADDEGRADGQRPARSARQARMRSRVFSWLPGRRIAFSTLGEACWNGTSR